MWNLKNKTKQAQGHRGQTESCQGGGCRGQVKQVKGI